MTATLAQQWMIDRKYTTRGGQYREPFFEHSARRRRVEPQRADHRGFRGAHIVIAATDDGLPKRQGKTIGMTFAWGKYRGPGSVVFSPASEKIVDGKGETTAKFSAPGEYILQVVVDDGSGENRREFRVSLLLDQQSGESDGQVSQDSRN